MTSPDPARVEAAQAAYQDVMRKGLTWRRAVKEALAAADAHDAAQRERYRHKKRGTEYEVIGTAELQMASDLVDGSELVIYRGDDSKMWARQSDEFHDGRFERIHPTPDDGGDAHEPLPDDEVVF